MKFYQIFSWFTRNLLEIIMSQRIQRNYMNSKNFDMDYFGTNQQGYFAAK